MTHALPEPSSKRLLKDGRTATIRPAVLADAPSLWDTARAVIEDGRGVVQTVEDVETLSEFTDDFRSLLKRRSGHLGALLVAVVDDRAVASSEVWRLKPRLLRHVAQLNLEVHPNYQRLGLGRALMETVIAWCSCGPGLEEGGVLRLGLATRADNARAIALYRGLGFVDEGVRQRFIRDPNGGFIDDLLMVRFFDASH